MSSLFCAILLFWNRWLFTFVHNLVNGYLPNILILQVSLMEEQRQESAKSDDENKANDGDPSSNETEPSNGKTDINGTPMDESQVTRSFGGYHN